MDFFPLRGGETRSVQPKTKSKRQTEAGRSKVPEWVDRLTYERFARTEDEPVWPRRRERLRKAGQGENEERARATRERVEKEFISSGHIDAVERAICAPTRSSVFGRQDTAEAREYMDAIATKQGAGPPVRQ